MKRFIVAVIVLFLQACPMVFGQAKVYTKKARLADFSSHTVKVVMVGNEVLNTVIRDELHSRWRLSPYEFCSPEEYESIKSNPAYYFLMPSVGGGIIYLSLFKGGDWEAVQSLDAAYEVIQIPVAREKYSSGREYVYFPAFIDIIQNYIEDTIISDRRGFVGLSSYNPSLIKGLAKPVRIADEDISSDVTPDFRAKHFKSRIATVPTDVADALFEARQDTVLVGFVVAPAMSSTDAVSYQYVVDPTTDELVYFSKHKYEAESSRGFSAFDLRYLSFVTRIR